MARPIRARPTPSAPHSCPASEPGRACPASEPAPRSGFFLPRSEFRLRSTPRSVFRLRFSFRFCPKKSSVSDAVLAVSLTECFFHHLHALPSMATGLLHPILLWQQDCSTQSCCGNRIAPPNPAVATGLLHPILLWQQDCSTQSCCGNRIASPNPAVATGLPRCTTSSSGLELFLPEHRLVMESARL